MRAIDFACRLLVNLATDAMSPAARLVMLCVAAGLENAEDIARLTGITPGTCTNLLRLLAKRQVLHCVHGKCDLYVLAPDGKEHVRQLLTFPPLPPVHAKETAPDD